MKLFRHLVYIISMEIALWHFERSKHWKAISISVAEKYKLN